MRHMQRKTGEIRLVHRLLNLLGFVVFKVGHTVEFGRSNCHDGAVFCALARAW